VQDARDEGRGGVEQAQVRFQCEPMRGGGGEGGPEDRVVVGEEGEDNPEEEGCCCGRKYQQRDQIMRTRCLRQTIMKVAKEEDGIVVDWQGMAIVGARKSSRKEVVRFARVCFCFLVFERLGITNELRASKDKLQGFL
jgi:hypothetical protein